MGNGDRRGDEQHIAEDATDQRVTAIPKKVRNRVQPVEPGAGYLIGVAALLTERTTSYCRFTVEDGSRTDIRAAGQVYAAVGLNTVAAIVAAE